MSDGLDPAADRVVAPAVDPPESYRTMQSMYGDLQNRVTVLETQPSALDLFERVTALENRSATVSADALQAILDCRASDPSHATLVTTLQFNALIETLAKVL
jgi:hypothetical protein